MKAWNTDELQGYIDLVAIGKPDFIEVKVGSLLVEIGIWYQAFLTERTTISCRPERFCYNLYQVLINEYNEFFRNFVWFIKRWHPLY